MIQVSGVWKRYDDLVAVRDFSFSVEERGLMGLIGPNGSGKTTLLRMIATLAKPDHGTITLFGQNTQDAPGTIRRRMGFMPAEFGKPQDMTIREYMDYFACAAGVPRQQRRRTIDDILELTDLAGRDDVMIEGLSTGNLQRLLLAKTLLGDPELLILDEPASGLDPRARAEVRALLRELSAMGKTIIISSHILADLEDICSSVCIIEEGTKIAAGNMRELIRGAARPYRLVYLRVPAAQAALAAERLKRLQDVQDFQDPRLDGDEAVLELSSLQKNCNYLLAALIDAEVEVLEMREEKPNLEDVFLRSTKGIVS